MPQGYWRENLITQETLRRCPLRDWIDAGNDPRFGGELARMTELYYPAYVDGHLLESGGIAQQPARYLDYMVTLRALETQVELRYLDTTKPKDAADAN